MVKDTIKKTRGAAGPSVMDANRWRCILISGNFENVAEDFSKSIPEMARRLEVRSANYLAAFLACRLIPLGNFQVLDLYKLKLLRRLVTGKILSRKIPTKNANNKYNNSQELTSQLTNSLKQREQHYTVSDENKKQITSLQLRRNT